MPRGRILPVTDIGDQYFVAVFGRRKPVLLAQEGAIAKIGYPPSIERLTRSLVLPLTSAGVSHQLPEVSLRRHTVGTRNSGLGHRVSRPQDAKRQSEVIIRFPNRGANTQDRAIRLA